MIINGRKIAAEIIADLKKRPKPKKFLAVFLVGNDASSVSFVKQKEKIARELSVDLRLYKYPESVKQDDLREEILKIAEHKTCGGVIVQLPLPGHINKHPILNVIPRQKDIDVLGERALGAFYADRNDVLPPAVGTTDKILASLDYPLSGKVVAVLGFGLLVGKPIANWLMSRAKTVFLLSKGSNFNILKEADLVVSGVGKADLFSGKDLKDGAVVIDFGYDSKNGKFCGDFNNASVDGFFYTPTPGGTGPILVAQVFVNFYELNRVMA